MPVFFLKKKKTEREITLATQWNTYTLHGVYHAGRYMAMLTGARGTISTLAEISQGKQHKKYNLKSYAVFPQEY